MKFGLRYASLGRYSNGPAAVEVAQAAEAAGFDSIWTVEHVVVPHGYQSRYPYSPSGRMGSGLEDYPIPDPLIWLAYIASATRTIKLGTAILILPQRNPVVTAKAVATLDHLAGGGRVLLGIGVGWLAEEFAAPAPSRTAARAPMNTWRRCARSGARTARATRAGSSRSTRCSAGPCRKSAASPSSSAATPWPRPGAPAASATAISPPGTRHPRRSRRCAVPRRPPAAIPHRSRSPWPRRPSRRRSRLLAGITRGFPSERRGGAAVAPASRRLAD